MTVYIFPSRDQSWMINFDNYLQTKNVLVGDKNNEDEWIHPGILLNTPKTHIIMGTNVMPRKRCYKIKLKAPPGWKGYERLPGAMDYIMTHWAWTWCDLEKCFFDACVCSAPQDRTQCVANPWWGTLAQAKYWVNRGKYEPCLSGNTKNKTWGPFLPGFNCYRPEFSAFFLYRIHLKFAGDSIWRTLPTSFNRQGMVPEAPGPAQAFTQTKKDHKKKKRPIDVFDILPGDLDSEGILKDHALARITGDSQQPKRPRLENKSRHILHRLREIGIQLRQQLRSDRAHTPPDPPWKGGRQSL